jgi:hypothetical protein
MSQADALRELISALRSIGVRYLVGGSQASSVLGVPRSTLDSDLVVELTVNAVPTLVAALAGNWYIDPDLARESIARAQSFNIVHMPSVHKIDLFPATTAFHRSQLERAVVRTLHPLGGEVECLVPTAEDMILAKLQWYQLGGLVSDRQWSDIIGMLYMNPHLDEPYLTHWAAQLGVTDLLHKAIAESHADFD